MIKFKIFGTEIEISFLLICFLNLILIIYGEVVLFWCGLSAIFHEFCHVLCLCCFGSKPNRLKFQISGIVLKKKVELPNFSNIIVLSAGCFGNLILFLFFYLIKFKFAMFVNLFLFVFNMLPHEKLDGGQLLEMFLQKCEAHLSLKIVKIVSGLTSILLIIVGIVLIFKFESYSLFFFAIMLNFSN